MVTPVAVVLLVDEDGRYLLGKRNAPGSPVHEKWEFPGGKVEAYETLHDAARREIREELGVEICLGALLPLTCAYSNAATGKHGLLIAVSGTIVTGEPTLTDSHLELRWFTAEEMEAAPAEMIPNSLEFLHMHRLQRMVERHAVRNGL